MLRAEDRVCGDAGGVIVGEPGEQARANDRQQCAGGEPPPAWAFHCVFPVRVGRRRGHTRERRKRRPRSVGVSASRPRQRVA